MDPQLPSFPAPELQRIYYGETFVQQWLQTLQRARKIATEQIFKSGKKFERKFQQKGYNNHLWKRTKNFAQ